jgi:hypothetical protein
VSRSNDLTSFLRASNFFISPTTSSDSHIIKPSTPQHPFTSLFINQRISFIHSFIAILHQSCNLPRAGFWPQISARQKLRGPSPRNDGHLNTSAFVALQAIG